MSVTVTCVPRAEEKTTAQQKVLELTRRIRAKTIIGYSYADDCVDERLYMIAYKKLSDRELAIIKALFPRIIDLKYAVGVNRYDKRYIYVQKCDAISHSGLANADDRQFIETHIYFSEQYRAKMMYAGMYNPQKVSM